MRLPHYVFASFLCSFAPAQLAINEVLVDPVGQDAGRQIVEIVNVGAVPFAPQGWQICAPFTYAAIPNVTFLPGRPVRLHIGASGQDTATDLFFAGFRTLAKADTFLIYRSSNFGNSNDIIDFVSWGGGTARIAQAVQVKQWDAATATVALPPEGGTLAWSGAGDAASSWYRDVTPTLGTPNGTGKMRLLGSGCALGIRATPAIASPLPPVDGNLDWAMRIDGKSRQAPVILIAGTQAAGGVLLFGCPLEVVPNLPVFPTTADAAGIVRIPFPLAVGGANLAGISFFVQALVVDAAAVNGLFAMSPGLQVVIGQ